MPIKKSGSPILNCISSWPLGVINHNAPLGSALLIIPLAIITTFVCIFTGESTQGVLTMLFIEMLAVLGLNIFFGNSGVGTFGQVAFMGLAAHVGALFTISPAMKAMSLPDLPIWLSHLHLNHWLALVVTVLIVGIFGLVIGLPISRLDGVAAAITTLCLLIIMAGVFKGAKMFTGGARALFGMPQFIGPWTAFCFAAACVFLSRIFRDSFAGLELRAAREDDVAARSIGIDVYQRRLSAWSIHAMVSAAAGFLMGCYLGLVSPQTFYLDLTFILIAMMIVGGTTTISGSVLGVLIISVLLDFLRRMEQGVHIGPLELPEMFGLTTLGLAASILAVMYWRRDGLLPYIEIDERLWQWRKHKNKPVQSPLKQEILAVRAIKKKDFALRPLNERLDKNQAGPRLVTNKLSKSFGGLRALQDVNLNLEYGVILGLIGPNGAGKTTLMNLIAGADVPSSGQVLNGPVDVTGWPAHKIARTGIGRTFQNIRVFSHLTVLENIAAGATATRRSNFEKSPEEWSREMLNEFGLQDFADQMAGTLSYGTQRTLEIARAMVTCPQFLLLDEPGAGMNRTEKKRLINRIQGLRRDYGVGILVVDHDLRMIAELCDSVVVLNEGRVIAKGPPYEIQQNVEVIEAYIGRKR